MHWSKQTPSSNNTREHYKWTSSDGQYQNQIDYILCSQRWRSSIQSAKTRPGADCGSDHELLIAKFRLKLKKVGKTTRPFRYDLNQIPYDYTVGEGNGTPLQYPCLENPMDGGAWKAAVHGVTKNLKWLSNFTFTFHFHALEKEMATHSSVLAWRIPGTGESGGLTSMGLHRVGHDWSDLALAAAAAAAT